MGGAPLEIKAVADYVAPTVEEDGLAVAIEKVIWPLLQAEKQPHG
jgi:hydroxymethylpyrimidine pyrophosphatase-like HAD family hydrolase